MNPAVPINFIKHRYHPLIVYDGIMTLSSYRIHRIYLAATMGYGLGSDDPEELAYYIKLRKEIEDMKIDPVKKGIPLSFKIDEGKDK